MQSFTCSFIGLGLIGGSIAKAIRHAIPNVRILAYDTNQDALQLALSEKVINEGVSSISPSLADCDYLFLCAPVSHNISNLRLLKPYLKADTLLTDVGSVKTQIHREVEQLGLKNQFIGGHPMAGSERFGYANSDASLLENAYYILTPSGTIAQEKITACQTLIAAIGAIPLLLTCEEHDYVTAAISHLPHIIAASLVNLVRKSDSREGVMKMIAAGGFKDITRIASSSPVMWQQICLTNTKNIETLLQNYIEDLQQIAGEISSHQEEALYRFFDEARGYRESFIDASSGPIKKAHVLTVDIADKPGAIAAIASLLAMHEISIKNIGINHNRELAEGALRIEFYRDTEKNAAKEVLASHGYGIHTGN